MAIYIKNNSEVRVAGKFVYNDSIYKLWKGGASLLHETNYTSMKPIDTKNIVTVIKKEGYNIRRFIELEGAPEEYLIKNGYKLKRNETRH